MTVKSTPPPHQHGGSCGASPLSGLTLSSTSPAWLDIFRAQISAGTARGNIIRKKTPLERLCFFSAFGAGKYCTKYSHSFVVLPSMFPWSETWDPRGNNMNRCSIRELTLRNWSNSLRPLKCQNCYLCATYFTKWQVWVSRGFHTHTKKAICS